eukprot:scaffold635_cov535-Prasinococcus_capsulatus_cf.AAC.1
MNFRGGATASGACQWLGAACSTSMHRHAAIRSWPVTSTIPGYCPAPTELQVNPDQVATHSCLSNDRMDGCGPFLTTA